MPHCCRSSFLLFTEAVAFTPASRFSSPGKSLLMAKWPLHFPFLRNFSLPGLPLPRRSPLLRSRSSSPGKSLLMVKRPLHFPFLRNFSLPGLLACDALLRATDCTAWGLTPGRPVPGSMVAGTLSRMQRLLFAWSELSDIVYGKFQP